MMEGANHGGLYAVAYARTALPFAALYGFAAEKLLLGQTHCERKVRAKSHFETCLQMLHLFITRYKKALYHHSAFSTTQKVLNGLKHF